MSTRKKLEKKVNSALRIEQLNAAALAYPLRDGKAGLAENDLLPGVSTGNDIASGVGDASKFQRFLHVELVSLLNFRRPSPKTF